MPKPTTVLAVTAHPNPQSFTAALVRETASACTEAGAELRVHDLYANAFNPVMSQHDLAAALGRGDPAVDVVEQRELIAAAELLILHYPVMWFDRPAIVKGWFDRVFGLGFAFGMNDRGSYGLLTGKRALVIQTAGTSPEFYRKVEADQYPIKGVLSGTLEFCGFEADVLTHYAVFAANDEARERMKLETREKVRQVLDSMAR